MCVLRVVTHMRWCRTQGGSEQMDQRSLKVSNKAVAVQASHPFYKKAVFIRKGHYILIILGRENNVTS